MNKFVLYLYNNILHDNMYGLLAKPNNIFNVYRHEVK